MKSRLLYTLGYWAARLGTSILCNPVITGREHIPETGGFILASNHISYYDPPVVGSFQKRELYFMAKRELFKNKLFGWILTAVNSIPVNRGRVDRQTIRRSVEVINNGYGLTFFPEGTRARKGELLPPQPGIGMIARRAECTIVPTYIHGLDRLKDSIRRRVRMSISYGEPLSAEWVKSLPTDREGYRIIAETVMERIALLRSEVINR